MSDNKYQALRDKAPSDAAFVQDGKAGAFSEKLTCRYNIASVCILSVPYHLDRAFDYLIPSDYEVKVGDFVAVPFGGGNRPETALGTAVSSIEDNSDQKLKYKPISRVLSTTLSLSQEAIELVSFLKERTFCTTGEAVRTITPSSAFSRLEECVEIVSDLPAYYPECSDEFIIYDFVSINPSCPKAKVLSLIDPKRAHKALTALVKDGVLSIEIGAKEVTNIRYLKCYRTELSASEVTELCERREIRSENHRAILEFLCEYGKCEQTELCEALSVSVAQIKALVSRGYVVCEEIERYRTPYSSKRVKTEVVLNEHQQKAVDTVVTLTKSGEPKAALLYGVTGSGKTQVMRAVMEDVIRQGRSVILLVPEISLTPQTISFFSASFGERTAVIHSGLSAGERFDAWRRIKQGDVDVCIGTRSAVFAPFKNLGLIVIDEEQEHTYKSDSSPKYNAKEVAAFRCAKHNATMLLASATPSVESYHKAVNGIYTLCELPSRYGSGGIPKTDIIDMRTETKQGNFSLFSERLINALSDNLADKRQSILFLNRRGYHSFMSCPSCGEVFTCPHCSVSLTHHHNKFNSKGYLVCHYCGYKEHIPDKCPKCGSEKMRFMGYGTQLAEEQLHKIFPEAKILRMDADTTATKFSYDEILGKFRAKEADILLGTQMVTKGHDFPEVTLVGMLSADQSLYVDDYRANERTFSLICQTVGRAGRRDEEGNALIQCYTPDHKVIEVARDQDYKAFYENEIPLRRSLLFPPFCDIASMTVTSDGEETAFTAATKLLDEIKRLALGNFSDVKLQIFGPFEAPVYKLNEKYRVRLVIKFKNSKRSRALFREALEYFGKNMPKTVSVGIDVNPTAL